MYLYVYLHEKYWKWIIALSMLASLQKTYKFFFFVILGSVNIQSSHPVFIVFIVCHGVFIIFMV